MPRVDYAGLNALVDGAYPARDWHDLCEAFRFQTTRLTNDLRNMQSFDSAKIALANSKIIDKNREAATPGQVGWWDITKYGHDMVSLGNDIWVGATGLGDTIHDLGGGLKVLHGSTYPATFLGRADTVGNNPKALLLPYNVAPSAPAAGGNATELAVPLSGVTGGVPWSFAPPTQDIQKRIQVALSKRGRYPGKQNGLWGPLSVKGIQVTIKNVGYNGGADGAPGLNTCKFVQEYAKKFGKYVGPVDKVLGPNSWLGFCRGLEAGLV